MRITTAICLFALFCSLSFTAQADEVRLDHRANAFESLQSYDQDTVTSDDGASGSDNLMIRIERDGYANDADNDIGGNGPLTRADGFNGGFAGGFDFDAN